MTFLYISIGQNYRQLELYDLALEYFDRAASINKSLGIEDPLPYLAIAKTYTRQGEFFAAALNAETALSFDPTNPDLYGQVGYIRFQARNYEGSMPMLECAVQGCEVLYDEFFGVTVLSDATEEQLATSDRIQVEGLGLSNASVVYYYVYASVLAASTSAMKPRSTSPSLKMPTAAMTSSCKSSMRVARSVCCCKLRITTSLSPTYAKSCSFPACAVLYPPNWAVFSRNCAVWI